MHTCTWRSVDGMILARFDKPKGESGIPSRLLPDAVVINLHLHSIAELTKYAVREGLTSVEG